ncbi:MAG: serine hydrolase [Ferruginibacter sp.]
MKKLKSMLIIAICFALFTGNNVSAQISSTAIDSLVQKAIDKFHVAGVAVAIVKDGKIIHEKGYGVRSINSKQPVDIHTNFQIASCSKSFTTAALSILIDEGKLSWKDKVKTYLPEFKMYNDYVTANFLVEDLLCHRSGLSANAGDLMEFPDGSDFTIKDVLTNLQYLQPVSAFRTQFDYDNQLYIVAGELIARISGMSWEKFVQTKILDALQMDHSFSALNTIKDSNNLASPHSSEAGDIKAIPIFSNQLTNAAGGIVSNVDDMSKWMIMQLNKGKYGINLEKKLFSEERQQDMWSMHTVINGNPFPPSFNTHFFGYGLGWNLADIKGNLLVAHSGGINGMTTELALIPDKNLGIIVLTNTGESAGAGIARAIEATLFDSYLGLDKMDWVAQFGRMIQFHVDEDTVTKKVWETVAKNENIKLNKQNYVGIYEDKWFGKVEVFFKGDLLWFKSYRSPKINGAMKFYKANTFAIKWEAFHDHADAFAMFSLDEEGMAQRIQLKDIFSLEGSHFQDLDFQRIRN